MQTITPTSYLQPLFIKSTETGISQLQLKVFKLERWQRGLRMLAVSKERKLQVSQAHSAHNTHEFSSFIEYAPAGICILSGAEFIFEAINPAYQELLADRNLIGLSILTAMPEIASQPIFQILKTVYETGQTYRGNDQLIPLSRFTNGPVEDRYFNFTYQARFDESGTVTGILVFVFDVTNLTLAKKELEIGERHSREMFNSIRQIAFTMNLQGGLTTVNKRWEEYTGLNYERDKDDVWQLTMHPDEIQPISLKFAELLEKCVGGEFEFRKRRYDGQYLWHLCYMLPILDNAGKVLFWMGTSTDIEMLKQSQQQKDDFINIASHELKTPLTSLKVSLQLLNERIDDLPVLMRTRLLSKASQSLDKVVNLVEDLLNVGKFNQGHFELNYSCFNIFELIRDCCADTVTSQFKVKFTGRQDILVSADAKRIEQVVINILNNALKYAFASDTLIIHIEQVKEFIKIGITDQGPGIAPDVIPRLFDRYYRVGNTNYETTGLGIGLYICSEIIKKHQGEINVISDHGSGSSFYFKIPKSLPKRES